MNEQTINMILQLAEQGGSMAMWAFIVHEVMALLKVIAVIGGIGWLLKVLITTTIAAVDKSLTS